MIVIHSEACMVSWKKLFKKISYLVVSNEYDTSF